MPESRSLWFLAATILAATILENVPLWADEPATDAAVRQALKEQVELKYTGEPLQQVAKEPHTKLDVPVYLDEKALADAGLAADAPVTFAISRVSAKAAIELMLKPLQLKTVVRHGVLIITTPEEAESMLDTRVYAVADLVLGAHGEGPGDFDSLIDMIKSTVKPVTWDDVGGPGSIAPCYSGINAIVVSQTDEVHDGIENLLAELRAVRDRQAHDGMVSTWPGRSGSSARTAVDPRLPPVAAAEMAVRRALARPVSFQFHQTPLGQVVAALRRRTGLQILADKEGSGGVVTSNVSLDTPVSAEVTNLPLDLALDAILKPLGLTWTYDRGCLILTTPEREDNLMFARAYDVSDLPAFRDQSGKGVPDFAAIIDIIRSTVYPTTWGEVGGPGSIATIDQGRLQAISISQTWKIHLKVEQLLVALRERRGSPLSRDQIARLPPLPSPEEPGSNDPETVEEH